MHFSTDFWKLLEKVGVGLKFFCMFKPNTLLKKWENPLVFYHCFSVENDESHYKHSSLYIPTTQGIHNPLGRPVLGSRAAHLAPGQRSGTHHAHTVPRLVSARPGFPGPGTPEAPGLPALPDVQPGLPGPAGLQAHQQQFDGGCGAETTAKVGFLCENSVYDEK